MHTLPIVAALLFWQMINLLHFWNYTRRLIASLNSMKYWQIIIENLRNAGWNCGCMATTDGKGRPIWVVAAERKDTLYCAIGRTFVIRQNFLTVSRNTL